MKMKIRCGLLAVLLLGSSVMAYAGNGTGLKRNQWDYGPEITLANPGYGIVLGEALALLYGEDRPHWAPLIISKTYITPSLHFSSGTYDRSQKRMVGRLDGSAKSAKWYDPDLKNFSVGYVVNFMSKEFPLGFSAKVAYEQMGFDATMSNEDGPIGEYEFRKQMIVPEVLLRVRIGNYRKGGGLICIELGGCYDYAIGAKCMGYTGTETVNSGVTGIIGFNLADPVLHLQIGADYYIPSYNFFNREFSPDGGATTPLNNTWWSSAKALSFYVRLGF